VAVYTTFPHRHTAVLLDEGYTHCNVAWWRVHTLQCCLMKGTHIAVLLDEGYTHCNVSWWRVQTLQCCLVKGTNTAMLLGEGYTRCNAHIPVLFGIAQRFKPGVVWVPSREHKKHLRGYAKTLYINQNEIQEPWTSSNPCTHEDSSPNWDVGMPETRSNISLTSQTHVNNW
jgi:hypothetical protein